jgi:hypothetical protein
MGRKLYPCQIPGCTKEAVIRSRIKQGKYTGLKACPLCKQMHDGKPKAFSPIKKRTKKASKKRKEERSCLTGFFEDSIEQLKKKPVCENCGCKIKWWLHPVNNVAHILKKSTYKSVMCHPLNRVFLCDSKDREDGKSCHSDFDNRIFERETMPVFITALSRFEKFYEECLENGKEKTIFEENL